MGVSYSGNRMREAGPLESRGVQQTLLRLERVSLLDKEWGCPSEARGAARKGGAQRRGAGPNAWGAARKGGAQRMMPGNPEKITHASSQA